MNAAERGEVRRRANDRCEYCQLPPHGQVAPFEVDHVQPRAAGGTSRLDNWAYACPHCNAHKWKHTHGIDPADGTMVPLFNPRSEAWAKHFRWSSVDTAIVEGTTTCGRATIERLKMNAPELVLIRRLLLQLEQLTHPMT